MVQLEQKKYFAWFPCIVKLETHKNIYYEFKWLETVHVEQKYQECLIEPWASALRIENKWVNIKFLDL